MNRLYDFYREAHANYGARRKGFGMVKEMVIHKGSLYWSTFDNSLDKESLSMIC